MSNLRGARCYLNWLGIKILENFNIEGHKLLLLFLSTQFTVWAGYRSRYSDWLRAGRSGDRIPVEARFSAPVQTGPGAHPASCKMGTGSFPGVKSGRGVTLIPHPLLVSWSWKSIATPLLPLWTVRPVQSLSACTKVHFTFTFTLLLPNVLTFFIHNISPLSLQKPPCLM